MMKMDAIKKQKGGDLWIEKDKKKDVVEFNSLNHSTNSTSSDIPWVYVSMLHTQAWCEIQIYLEYVCGQEREIEKAVIEGREKHEELDKEFYKFSIPCSIEELFEAGGIRRDFAIKSEKLQLIGRIDEVQFFSNEIWIIDDKPNGATPFLTHRQQVWGYALLMKTEHKKLIGKRKLICVLRDRDTGKVRWSREFNKIDEEHTKKTVKRIFDILIGNFEPVPTKKAWKCRSCSLNCKYRLAGYEKN